MRKGIFFVHGLNNSNDMFDDYKLNLESRYHIETPILPGHYRGSRENVAHEDMLNSLESSLNEFHGKIDEYVYVGFSLGALLGLDLFLKKRIPAPKKFIFIAPAFKIRPHILNLLKLSKISPNIRVPSPPIRECRANNYTLMSCYRSLVNSYESVSLELNQASSDLFLGSPVEIYVDPKDEFICAKSLSLFSGEFKNCQLFPIHSKMLSKHLVFKRHHIAEEEGLKILESIKNF